MIIIVLEEFGVVLNFVFDLNENRVWNYIYLFVLDLDFFFKFKNCMI